MIEVVGSGRALIDDIEKRDPPLDCWTQHNLDKKYLSKNNQIAKAVAGVCPILTIED
jgi:hypothetical protein